MSGGVREVGQFIEAFRGLRGDLVILVEKFKRLYLRAMPRATPPYPPVNFTAVRITVNSL